MKQKSPASRQKKYEKKYAKKLQQVTDQFDDIAQQQQGNSPLMTQGFDSQEDKAQLRRIYKWTKKVESLSKKLTTAKNNLEKAKEDARDGITLSAAPANASPTAQKNIDKYIAKIEALEATVNKDKGLQEMAKYLKGKKEGHDANIRKGKKEIPELNKAVDKLQEKATKLKMLVKDVKGFLKKPIKKIRRTKGK